MSRGLAVLGAGVAGLIAAAALGGVAVTRVSEALDEELLEDEIDGKAEARVFARAADALFITGGALGAAGVVTLVVSYTRGKRENRMAVLPQLGPRSAALTVVGRF